MAKEKTETYVLKKGHTHHGFDEAGERHFFVGGEKGNDRVQLNAVQAKAFADKFDSERELRARAQVDAGLTQREITREEALRILELTEDEVVTIKKPDPQPSVGTAEPAPKDVTPAPVGSTSDPVNAPLVPPTTKVGEESKTAAAAPTAAAKK